MSGRLGNWLLTTVICHLQGGRREELSTSWVLAAVAGFVSGRVAAAQGPPPIFTKNTALRLPVQLDERARADVARAEAVRPRAGRAVGVRCRPLLPTQTAFDYRAPTDGEYWFTFVTVDRRGNASPG